MSIMFMKIRSVSRGQGDHAIAKAAYVSRSRLRDPTTGTTHDFRRVPGLVHSEIVLPADASDAVRGWATDRRELWRAAEAAERQWNARVAREYTVALPHELRAETRVELARSLAQRLADRHAVVIDVAVHAPTARGDPRNHHMHLLATTREPTDEGLGPKATVELNTDRRRALGLVHIAAEYRALRGVWASLANEHLREAGLEARLEPRARHAIERALEAELTAERHATRETGLELAPAAVDTRAASVRRWEAYKAERAAGLEVNVPTRTRTRARERDTGLEL